MSMYLRAADLPPFCSGAAPHCWHVCFGVLMCQCDVHERQLRLLESVFIYMHICMYTRAHQSVCVACKLEKFRLSVG
jgi:hypothetical protein